MPKGMFVDTSICTGCKACQVACKQWNGLEPEPAHFRPEPGVPYPVAFNFTGNSYDNTGRLSARDWRHVLFIEQIDARRSGSRWLFMSDSCKHCTDAACLNVCPVEAIEHTDLGNVVVRQEKCVGTKLCNKACPYGVIAYNEQTRTSHKCTLCNDRIHNGLGTACADACPTGSILFGEVPELKAAADARLARLRAAGESRANLYGYTEAGGLNVFYLLLDDPAVYGLPEKPMVPQRKKSGALPIKVTALMAGLAALVGWRERGSRDPGQPQAARNPAPVRRHLHVACAIIEREGLILAAQRSGSMSLPLKWEFPGGKIREGERPEECLARELVEELGVSVVVVEALPRTTHDYPDFTVTLHPFSCDIESGEITLHEHAAIRWLPPDQLAALDWAEADLPIIELLQR